jgi:quinol monooxygenase YgiN
MPAIAVIATARYTDTDDKERLQEAFLAHRDRSLRDESGTLVFEVLIPDDTEQTFMAYEVYSDEAALAAHMEGNSYHQTITDLEGIQFEISLVRGVRLD